MKCRVCGNEKLREILDLGYHAPSDAFLENLDEPETSYPLKLMVCPVCCLAQISYVVPKDVLYNDKYPYETGCNRLGVQHFRAFAESVIKEHELTDKHTVMDIGSNDGTLLKGFKEHGCKVIGIEPCKVIAKKANELGIHTINSFFPADVDIKADIITAANVFAHVDDWHSLMCGVDRCLKQYGTFIIEAPALDSLITNLEYDTIYHEHLSFLSPYPLNVLLERHNMGIIKTEHQDIHGGSTRYFIKRKTDHTIRKFSRPNMSVLDDFAERVANNKKDLTELLWELRNKKVVGVSAPAKGNTLLNYCGITLDYITETSPLKIGKFTPGRHIPIVSDSRLLKEQPDFALILAWNWADQIMENLKEFKGKWIIPIPEVVIANR
jgi:SAM-dependent methyltransferase